MEQTCSALSPAATTNPDMDLVSRFQKLVLYFFTHTKFQVSCGAYFSLNIRRDKNKFLLKCPCPLEHGSEIQAN